MQENETNKIEIAGDDKTDEISQVIGTNKIEIVGDDETITISNRHDRFGVIRSGSLGVYFVHKKVNKCDFSERRRNKETD
ncbi:hypothetical protein Ccrd_017242 [Cynara cardunculus var. scolymus]|uniref:Uncharacterized protein n=1 Tax=Cynara cardunculus var. scolymus TaxID=59895 RepID=A0A118K2I7_CYNCS|nr:hypothetical protein Ccrd_017242 [Cynara cardunculus var. scolymus]